MNTPDENDPLPVFDEGETPQSRRAEIISELEKDIKFLSKRLDNLQVLEDQEDEKNELVIYLNYMLASIFYIRQVNTE
jgi:hypothetical protein